MLLFRSEAEIEEWRRIEKRRRGAVLTLDQVWELSGRWYHDRMSPRFRGRAVDEAIAVFRALGLTDDFWTMPPN
ncbi:MAG: hypothetical protein F4X87_11110 [Chloroflexi bacterium]|nr:hypothetical protein [Chloroflexota bacterium]